MIVGLSLSGVAANGLLASADRIMSDVTLKHEAAGDTAVFAKVRSFLPDDDGLEPLHHTHEETTRLSRRLAGLTETTRGESPERPVIEVARRVIETPVTSTESTPPGKTPLPSRHRPPGGR